MTSDVDDVLARQIHGLSEMTTEDLNSLTLIIERAYVHVQIERALRDGVSP